MKQKTVITTNDIKVIAVVIMFILFVGCVEAIADTFAEIMTRLLP